jgi:quinol monooxygenase YgiN
MNPWTLIDYLEDRRMIYVLASVSVKEGKRAEFLDIFKANVANVLEEKGCIEYRPTVDLATDIPPQELDPNQVTIIEKWDSLDDLKNHLSAPHMLTYRELVSDLVVKVSLKVLQDG